MIEQEKLDWIERHCLDWMEDQDFCRNQVKAAALVLADILGNMLILKTDDDEAGRPQLYISFGNYDMICGRAWDYDDENQVWGELTIESTFLNDDKIIIGERSEP